MGYIKIIAGTIILVFLSPVMLMGDGAVYTTTAYPSSVLIPNQEAFITFNGKKETITLKITFEGKGKDFAWIVPVPGYTEVESADSNLFRFLESISPPEVITTDNIFLPVILTIYLVLALLAIIFQKQLQRFGISNVIMIIIFIIFIIAIILPNIIHLTGHGARKSFIKFTPGVKVYKTKRIGLYEVNVLSAPDTVALIEWFNKNGYHLPDEAKSLFEEYVKEKWYFIASRLASDNDTNRLKTEMPPLKFTFNTEKIIYPMKLTSLSRNSSSVLIYVLSTYFVKSNRFRVEKRKFLIWELPILEKKYKVNIPAAETLCFTKLFASLSPQDMKEDIILTPTQKIKEYSQIVYTAKAKQWAFILIIFTLLLIFAITVLRCALLTKIVLTIFAIVIILLTRPLAFFTPPHYTYREIRTFMTPSIKANMHTVQVVVENFAEQSNGYYPANISTQLSKRC